MVLQFCKIVAIQHGGRSNRVLELTRKHRRMNLVLEVTLHPGNNKFQDSKSNKVLT